MGRQQTDSPWIVESVVQQGPLPLLLRDEPEQLPGPIDVSKDFLDLGLAESAKRERFGNSVEGIAELTDQLVQIKPDLVVLEATGGYEASAVASFAAAQLPVVVVNPRRVRDFRTFFW